MQQFLEYAPLFVGVIFVLLGIVLRRGADRRLAAEPENGKYKTHRKLATVLVVIGAWSTVVKLLALLFGSTKEEKFHVSIFASRIKLGGITISETVIYTWVVMAALVILALLLRIFVVSRMKDVPHGAQNALELMVETLCSFTHTRVGDLGDNLPAYLFTVALFMVGCAAVELMGVRAPTGDITMTFALAIITFFLINYYGIKKKGVGGRIKSFANPTPVVFPMKIISDLAIPVSLACRLFGNMLGGMIVMDLLYFAMRNAAIGVPSVLGLYFNVFHPLIQAYIFITLSLTFIGEATE